MPRTGTPLIAPHQFPDLERERTIARDFGPNHVAAREQEEFSAAVHERAIEKPIATPPVMVLEVTRTIIDISAHHMATAITQTALEHGMDPHGALIVAGAIVAAAMSGRSDADRVLVPASADVLAAYGAHPRAGALTWGVRARVLRDGQTTGGAGGPSRAVLSGQRTDELAFASPACEAARPAGPSLRPRQILAGPAVVDQPTTALLIPPGRRAELDGEQNFHLKGEGAAA